MDNRKHLPNKEMENILLQLYCDVPMTEPMNTAIGWDTVMGSFLSLHDDLAGMCIIWFLLQLCW
jgi:hypothetical protein